MPHSAPEQSAAQRLNLSISPFFRLRSIGLPRRSPLPTILDGKVLLTTSGRSALALALRTLQIEPGDEVLIPAYHCLALSSPVGGSGATAVSYRMTERLAIDMNDLKSRLTPRTRCIVAVHFFGFPEPLDELRSLCDDAGIVLIEDCAHSLYGPGNPATIGRTGDFAIGSLMKFFPLFDGGCLASFRREIGAVRLQSRGALFQLKAIVHIVERSAMYSHSLVARAANALIAGTIARVKQARPELNAEIAKASPAAVFGSVTFEDQWTDSKMSLASRAIQRVVDHDRVITRRRQHYSRYAAALADVVGGVPFRPELPEGVVPYVFPFLLNNPQAAFGALRAAGVPMYRWEDVDEKACEVTRRYKHSLVQFPCHQELTDHELERLLTTIVRVLRDTETGVRA
jgi:perosamine synthetase